MDNARRHPYQCLALRSGTPERSNVLLAAAGAHIFSIDLASGTTIDTWPEPKQHDTTDAAASPEIIIADEQHENGEPPSKRRKTSKQPRKDNDGYAFVTKLLITKDGKSLIATTGEDKSVHVWNITEDGKLEHQSQRRMIKRPCAMTLNAKEDHVLVGDKFGDVYALPLVAAAVPQSASTAKVAKPASAPFKPAATNLTVHTAKNLKSLESQKRQAELLGSADAKEKEDMDFDHELLLGHVSMLTDIAVTSIPAEKSTREYIITTDRDEHIRLSRGRPQAHIIENYCFGHTQFVSKTCLIRPDTLVSGGGESELFIWKLPDSQLRAKIDLRPGLESYWKLHGGSAPVPQSMAVSGIWAVPCRQHDLTALFCALEGIAALFRIDFAIDSVGESPLIPRALAFAGNVLDLVSWPWSSDTDEEQWLVSIDTVHKPNSMDLSMATDVSRLQLGAEVKAFDLVDNDQGELVDAADLKKLQDSLYTIERLRKRGNEED